MEEVSENIFIGNERDCFHDERDDWAVVHACKSPCHQRKVGYRGALPQTHPEYLISENGNHLYLNMVDMSRPFSPVYTHPIFKRVLEFMNSNIGSKKILIHCNLGQSRSASIALVYLARRGVISQDSFTIAYDEFVKLFPQYNPGEGIKSYLVSHWEELIDDNFIK